MGVHAIKNRAISLGTDNFIGLVFSGDLVKTGFIFLYCLLKIKKISFSLVGWFPKSGPQKYF